MLLHPMACPRVACAPNAFPRQHHSYDSLHSPAIIDNIAQASGADMEHERSKRQQEQARGSRSRSAAIIIATQGSQRFAVALRG
jgi:hypothetical protein